MNHKLLLGDKKMGMIRDSIKLVFGQLSESQNQEEKYRHNLSEKRKQFDIELKKSQDRINDVRSSIQRTKR
jgi:hypothetical protein